MARNLTTYQLASNPGITAFPLPIQTVLPAIKTQLAEQRNLVLQAPPDAGKTTLVPLALLDESWLKGRKILLLASRELRQADPALLHRAMLDGIRQSGLDCLPWNRDSRDWQARVLSLRH